MAASNKTLYVLFCEGGHYYVGSTSNVDRRVAEHERGRGSAWTRKHKPVRLVETRPVRFRTDEDALVKEYMAKKGIDEVRGGSYSQIKLSEEEEQLLIRELLHAADCCLMCGSHNHYVRNCPRKNDSDSNSYYSSDEEDGGVVCYACGKPGHVRPACKYKNATCYSCGTHGHIAPACREEIEESSCDYDDDDDEDIICYACGKPGHVRPQCRYKDATCYKCHKHGHIAPACLSS